MMQLIGFMIAVAIAYLLGSISSSILVSKALKLPDPRTQGSGNAGATNVLRSSGKIPAILTLIGDMIKGLLAISIAKLFGVSGFFVGLTALAVVIGHIFPVFFGFKGGKGIATAAGTLLALTPPILMIAVLIWGGVLAYKRWVSLASIITAAAVPMLLLFSANVALFIPFTLIALLIIWKHQDNIKRLRAGTESKV